LLPRKLMCTVQSVLQPDNALQIAL